MKKFKVSLTENEVVSEATNYAILQPQHSSREIILYIFVSSFEFEFKNKQNKLEIQENKFLSK